MTQKYILLCLFLWISQAVLGQEFPNLDLSQYVPTPNSTNFDPIANNSTTAPWRISHGSPLVNPFEICVFAGEDENDNTPFDSCDSSPDFSEGAFYPYLFMEGHKYDVSFTYEAGGGEDNSVDEVFIRLANGVPDNTNNGNIDTRTYCVPNVTDYQEIFYDSNITTTGSSF